MSKKKEFKVPGNKQPVYSCFKLFLRLLFRRPEIINLAGDIPQRAIVIANHSNKSGPPALDMYYPVPTVKWGAYQMFGNFRSRREYLRDILYIQKCGYSRARASFLSPFLAAFNPMVYKGLRMIPSYPDGRLKQTVKNSCRVLDANMYVMIFPENSNNGYKDVLTELFSGFVLLAEKYYRYSGQDIPVIPVYYCVKKRIMVIGKPGYVHEMVAEGLNKHQIAERFRTEINGLYYDYVQNR